VVLAVVLSVMVRAIVEVISARSLQVTDVVETAGVHAQCPHFKRRSERLPQPSHLSHQINCAASGRTSLSSGAHQGWMD